MTQPALERHITNLDILRAIAVLAVMAHHIFAFTGIHTPYFAELGGLVGVQLFFVISGYLIAESATHHSLKNYALHRFFRIFPAYWIAYLGVGLFSGALTWERIAERPGSFLLNLANLQQLYAPALLELDVLHVTWSLTVEVLWYLLAPLVVIAYRRWAWLAFGGMIALSLLWSMAAERHLLHGLYAHGFAAMTQAVLPGQDIVLINAGFPAELMFFGLGALIYRYRQQALGLGSSLLVLTVFLTLGLAEHYINLLPSPTVFTGLGIAALFILLLRAPAFDVPFLVHIGKISYSVYLLHFPVIIWSFQKWGYLGKMHLLLTLALIFGLAHLMYILVERPFMRYARRLSAAEAPLVPGEKVAIKGLS
jgi:peptidoglycan/LPS O-acetylase OafA/YrhL